MFIIGGHIIDEEKLSVMARDYISRAIAGIPAAINLNNSHLSDISKIISNATANDLLEAVYDRDLIIEDAILTQIEINKIIDECSIDNGNSLIIIKHSTKIDDTEDLIDNTSPKPIE